MQHVLRALYCVLPAYNGPMLIFVLCVIKVQKEVVFCYTFYRKTLDRIFILNHFNMRNLS